MIDAAFGHWFAGFIDGEGCFYIGRVGSKNRPYYTVQLCVGLRCDDQPLLEEITARLDMGKICVMGERPAVQWAVSRHADLLRLVELFDTYPLRSKKARDYKIWREAVLLKKDFVRGRVGNDWTPIATLHDDLRAVRELVA